MRMALAEPLIVNGVPNIPGLEAPHDLLPAIAGFAAKYRRLLTSG